LEKNHIGRGGVPGGILELLLQKKKEEEGFEKIGGAQGKLVGCKKKHGVQQGREYGMNIEVLREAVRPPRGSTYERNKKGGIKNRELSN